MGQEELAKCQHVRQTSTSYVSRFPIFIVSFSLSSRATNGNQNFPGVCDGIFFDEALPDITDDLGTLDDVGVLYQNYNDYTIAKVRKRIEHGIVKG